jgi:uncharacterized SAM-binding protein YcdF (DUF218 family)
MVAYGTNIVAGTSPNKAGTDVEGIPVYGSIKDIQQDFAVDISVIFVPAAFAKAAMFEAIDAGVPLIVCITEHIPVHDMLAVRQKLKGSKSVVIGPNCPGVLLPGGNLLGIIVSVMLMIITANWTKFCGIISKIWGHGAGKFGLIFVSTLILAGIIYVGILSILMYKAQENRPEKANVIVVLGCQVKGERPSRMLRRRLDAAITAMNDNPDTLCIVSGGKGDDEKISEALAMKNYLLEKGMDSDRIIMEDKSTSTYENIQNSLKILDELGMSHDMTIVTDGFHQYRASLIAKAQGVENVTAYSAYTEPRYLFTYWVREWLGLTHFFMLGS